jgi:trk system potassium uptake protein TrkH
MEHAFRSAIFEVVSFMTTTGLYNDDAGKWPHVTWVILALCMFIGACSWLAQRRTEMRAWVDASEGAQERDAQRLHPNAVLPLKINDQNISNSQRVSLLAFITAYLVLVLVTAFIMIAAGIDNTNAISPSASAASATWGPRWAQRSAPPCRGASCPTLLNGCARP